MKPIKVFYAVQVSNFTKTEDGKNKWLLRNDACTNIAIGIISTILEKYPNDFTFLVKLPAASDTADVRHLEDLFKSKYLDRIEFFRDNIPHSPVTSRFHFDFLRYASRPEDFQEIDIMINDENTLTKNWNVLFNHLGLRIPIISTNYFLDSPIANKVPEKIRYYERQMESFINSDIAAFQCEAGRVEAMEAYDHLYRSRDPLAPQSVWGVGAHYAEISEYHTTEKFKIPTIYFGNRISDTANRYTNYDTFAEAIGILSTLTDKPFRAVMLNPTRKVTPEQLELINKLSRHHVEVMSNNEKFTRKDYLEFINRAHISCNLFVTEVHGGVTHCEALMAKNMVVMPKVNNYWHKFVKAGHETYPLFCSVSTENPHKPDAYDLAHKILLALEWIGTEAETVTRNLCHEIGYEYESYERACDRIVSDLQRLAGPTNTYSGSYGGEIVNGILSI
jgi:hypothetical protein